MRASRIIAAACLASLVGEGAACSAFSGADSSGAAAADSGATTDANSNVDPTIDGDNNAPDASFDGSSADANAAANTVPSAPGNSQSPCGGGGAYADGGGPVLFCDDFENVVAPGFGFSAVSAADPGHVDVVAASEGKTKLLRVQLDTAHPADAGYPVPVFLTQAFTQNVTIGATLEYDIFVASPTLSYATYGVLLFSIADNSEEVGAGGTPQLLQGPMTKAQGTVPIAGWHHVTAFGGSSNAAGSTTIDATTVQTTPTANVFAASAKIVIGITEGRAAVSSVPTVVYFDNVIVH